jgi:hypothetical protein
MTAYRSAAVSTAISKHLPMTEYAEIYSAIMSKISLKLKKFEF